MKTLKYFVLVMFAFLAVSCSEEVFTPREGEDDNPPIVIGGGGGTGQPGGGGSGNPVPSGDGERTSKDKKNPSNPVVHVEI